MSTNTKTQLKVISSEREHLVSWAPMGIVGCHQYSDDSPVQTLGLTG